MPFSKNNEVTACGRKFFPFCKLSQSRPAKEEKNKCNPRQVPQLCSGLSLDNVRTGTWGNKNLKQSETQPEIYFLLQAPAVTGEDDGLESPH